MVRWSNVHPAEGRGVEMGWRVVRELELINLPEETNLGMAQALFDP